MEEMKRNQLRAHLMVEANPSEKRNQMERKEMKRKSERKKRKKGGREREGRKLDIHLYIEEKKKQITNKHLPHLLLILSPLSLWFFLSLSLVLSHSHPFLSSLSLSLLLKSIIFLPLFVLLFEKMSRRGKETSGSEGER